MGAGPCLLLTGDEYKSEAACWTAHVQLRQTQGYAKLTKDALAFPMCLEPEQLIDEPTGKIR